MKLSLKSLLPAREVGSKHARTVCGQLDCHNKTPMRYVPGSHAGVFVDEQWYCSPDCFATASRNTLSVLSAGCVVEMQRHPRLSLGLALLSKGYLSEEQLRFASTRSQRQGEDLETTLIECGLATERQLAAGRAAQWGYPVLGQELTGQTVEADLPPTLLRAFSAVPLHYSAQTKRLVLGFVYRVDHSLLQSIERITGCRAEPCFITATEFMEQMDRLKSAPGYDETVVDQPGTAPQMAKTLGSFVDEVIAREARFTKCNAFVWARLSGKRGTLDVIFKMKHTLLASPATIPIEHLDRGEVEDDHVLGRAAGYGL